MKGLLAMLFALALTITGYTAPVLAAEISLHQISSEGVGQSIGTVTALDSDDGLVISEPTDSNPVNTASICMKTAAASPPSRTGCPLQVWPLEATGIPTTPATISGPSAKAIAAISAA